MVSWLFFAAAFGGSIFTLFALIRVAKLGPLTLIGFAMGWPAGEFALWHLAWQAVATVVFVALGALAQPIGMVGLLLTFISWFGLLVAYQRSKSVVANFESALEAGLGTDYSSAIQNFELPKYLDSAPKSELIKPFRRKREGMKIVKNLQYGPHGKRNMLDIYLPSTGEGPWPTLIYVHGGGWTIGNKEQQGIPLLIHLAANGWACVTINYRLSPRATFPDHIVDVKRAISWVREQGPEYGCDTSLIAITGGSAGGHLTALAGLTPNYAPFQPDFETADTHVDLCMPIYGCYDFLEGSGFRTSVTSMRGFLEKTVMKTSPVTNRKAWEEASPFHHINPDAPPFFIIHGANDSLLFVEEARHFVDELRRVSKSTVVYAEIPHAQHAFEQFQTRRGLAAVSAIGKFLEFHRAKHQTRADEPTERREVIS